MKDIIFQDIQIYAGPFAQKQSPEGALLKSKFWESFRKQL